MKKPSLKVYLLSLMGLHTLIAAIASRYVSVWHDEGYSMIVADSKVQDLMVATMRDVHPPLYYLLLKGWSLVFGNSILSMRLMSTFFACATTLVVALLVKKFVGRKYVYWVVPFILFSPAILRYSQEMRMYTMSGFFVALSSYLFLSLLSGKYPKGRKSKWAIYYAISIVLTLYTQYFAGLIVAVHGLVLAAYIYKKFGLTKKGLSKSYKDLKWLIGPSILAFVAYLPWLPILIKQTTQVTSYFWVPEVTIKSPLSTISMFTVYWQEWRAWTLTGPHLILGLAALGIVALAHYKLAKLRDISLETKVLLLSALIVPMIILFVLSLGKRPLYYDRYFVSFAPIFYATMAIGSAILWQSRRRIVRMSIVALVCMMGLGVYRGFAFNNNFGRSVGNEFSMRLVSAKLFEQLESSDAVVSNGSGYYFDIYAYMTRADKGNPLIWAPQRVSKEGNVGPIYLRPDLEARSLESLNADRIWIIAGKSDNIDHILGDNWKQIAPEITQGYVRAIPVSRY